VTDSERRALLAWGRCVLRGRHLWAMCVNTDSGERYEKCVLCQAIRGGPTLLQVLTEKPPSE